MTRLRGMVWMGAALFILPAPAAAQAIPDVCAAIARIAAAAREQPRFESVRRAVAAGQIVVPGFEPGECSVSDSGLDCGEEIQRGALHGWPDLADCPGVVAFEPPPPPPPRQLIRSPLNRHYRLGRFRIDRWVYCPRCAALGPSNFSMRIEEQGRPEE